MSRKKPFEETIKHSMELRGITFSEAMNETQQRYESFVEKNNRLTERQDDRVNTAQIQLISHFALLATLTLTVIGFLITQNDHILTDSQHWTILFIILMQILSLFFGSLDYWQTIKFHSEWARVYQKVGNEVSEKVDNGEVQKFSDLTDIKNSLVDSHRIETNKLWTILMVTLCLVGLGALLILFYAYFFDVPFWN